MATTITTSAIVSAFGNYYIDGGQGQKDLHTRLMYPFKSLGAFTIVNTDNTRFRSANVRFTEAIQAFQKTFTPKGGITFTPNEIPLFNIKSDNLFFPDELASMWLSFFTSNTLDRTQWPLVRWFIEVYLIGKINEDMEVNGIFTGVRVEPTTGVAGPSNAAMNGFRKWINDAITASTCTPIVTGAPSSDIVAWATQVETFVAGVPSLYRRQPMALNMSPDLALAYRQGKRKKYNMAYEQSANLDTVQDFPNISIAERDSQIGSNKIWMCPPGNAICLMKGTSNMDVFEVEKVDRQVKVYNDFSVGVGALDNSLIFTNDQDLT